MKFHLNVVALAALGSACALPALADVTIPYNEYSESPTIGRGGGTSTDPRDPGYGALKIFIEKVKDYTDDKGPDALPPGQKVIFQRDQKTGREISALRAGIQFADKKAEKKFAEPSWGFAYNSVPFGMRFEQMLGFLYEAKIDGVGTNGGNGLALAQSLLDARGGTQVVLPVVGSTMQGSGYFPQPIGKPQCNAGDADCLAQGEGIGLAGLCQSGWRIRYLAPPQDIVDRACDILVKRGTIAKKTLSFYPPVGGQSVLLPMQKRTIQGFEYVNPYDDFADFFPIKGAAPGVPLGNPELGPLDCSPAQAFPIPAGTKSNCTQNIGQTGGRYAHHPSWHQPFLISWMHIDKDVWNGLTPGQRAAIERAAKDALVESYKANESVECARLKDILDINQGVHQRDVDGSRRLVKGKPVSAAMTLARWPDDALKVLEEATKDYLAALAGPAEGKTPAQQDFTRFYTALTQYAKGIGATKFEPGTFPAKTGLKAGEQCRLVK
jgi:hypothetical protein